MATSKKTNTEIDPLELRPGKPALTLKQRLRLLHIDRDGYRLYIARLAGEIVATVATNSLTPADLEAISAKASAIDEALVELVGLIGDIEKDTELLRRPKAG
jgi:hypothetical protein